MTGADALLSLEGFGARFALNPDGTIRAELPDPGPDAMPFLLAELKAHRADVVEALQRRYGAPLPTCTNCPAPVTDPNDLLCQACYQARRGPGTVLSFEPSRRARAERGRLGRLCPDCQTVSWYVTSRGDTTCRTCAIREGTSGENGEGA